MDLVERYLYAVRCCLPKAQQDDVVRELSEDLHSQMEDREAELGRSLNEAEQEAMLKQMGHPLLLAARYAPQRQLIGPVIFPIYWFILKVAVAGAFVINAVAAAVLVGNGSDLGQQVSRLAMFPLGPGLMVFAWVTMVFAVFDKNLARIPFVSSWSPRALPAVPKDPRAPSTVHVVAEIIATTIGILWWAAVPRYQWLLFGPASALLELGPALQVLHMAILLLASANLVVLWINLIHPEWVTFRAGARIVSNVLSVGVMGFLVRTGELVVARPSAGRPAAESISHLLNSVLVMGLGIAAIVVTFETLREVMRLVGRWRAPNRWSPRQG